MCGCVSGRAFLRPHQASEAMEAHGAHVAPPLSRPHIPFGAARHAARGEAVPRAARHAARGRPPKDEGASIRSALSPPNENGAISAPLLFSPPSVWPLAPEILEPIRRHLGVTGSMHDALVAEVVLQGSGIVAVIGELIAAGMTQHVRMDAEWHFGSLAEPLDEPVEADRCQHDVAGAMP
jgi:hypothetical protein